MEPGPLPSALDDETQKNGNQALSGSAGTSRIDLHVELEAGARVEIRVEMRDPQGRLLEQRQKVFSNPPAPAEAHGNPDALRYAPVPEATVLDMSGATIPEEAQGVVSLPGSTVVDGVGTSLPEPTGLESGGEPQPEPTVWDAGWEQVRALQARAGRVGKNIESWFHQSRGRAAPVEKNVSELSQSQPGWAGRLRLSGLNPGWLFGGSLAIYLLVRLIGLADFPIFFFTDEAVQSVLANDLVRDGLHGYSQEFLPTFFPNGSQYNLSVSVYLQVISNLLLGHSVWATRAISVLVTLLAAFAVGRILKDIYHSPHPWTAILVLSAVPVWFLHSRTAFETALATSFYAGFLYFYMMYRCTSPRYLYAAIGLGVLAMYTYSPMQMVMLVTAVLLLVSDARYHWQQRATWLRGAGLLLLLALPYVRFVYSHPSENLRHLQILDSYWVRNIPLGDKLNQFFSEYARGLSPSYWYLPNSIDFVRHRMGDYGHLLGLSLPLMLFGLILTLKKIRFSPNRVLLVALIAAPSGAALVNLEVTRALSMVIPAALITALGLSTLLVWLERFRVSRGALALLSFALLAGFNLYLLDDALTQGPTWFHDYGLGGMQYGARQVFAAVEQEAAAHPEEKIILSPSWANGTDVLGRFFEPEVQSFQMGSVDGYMDERLDLNDQTMFVMIPEELDRAIKSGKFTDFRLEKILPYPDGKVGFYFVRLRYSAGLDAMLTTEKQNRKKLREDTLTWDGTPVQVSYPALDIGQIADIFDGNDASLLRSVEANPLALDMRFTQAKTLHGFSARIGGAAQQVTLTVYSSGQAQPWVFSQKVLETSEPRYVYFAFPKTLAAARIQLDVLSIYDQEPAHVHLWEVKTW
jgi:hypothetical protein